MSAPDAKAPVSAPISPGTLDAAVIDVGSNSVRLVIYRVDGRALWTVYNEKIGRAHV